jgi:uridine phosphorylase
VSFRERPILRRKRYGEQSVFTPEALLREARRQKGYAASHVPEVCLLDPDGDILVQLQSEEAASKDTNWACYHTNLFKVTHGSFDFGVIAGVVGASFSVLVAEELFASGCQLLISISSAGRIVPDRQPPYFVLIERALRDEGTSYHYLPPSRYSMVDASLLARLRRSLVRQPSPILFGDAWTTDAPFRETASEIDYYRSQGILAVEMEAAALYAFAEARRKRVVCIAYVTNTMGTSERDFEKGHANGARDSLAVFIEVARACQDRTILRMSPS